MIIITDEVEKIICNLKICKADRPDILTSESVFFSKFQYVLYLIQCQNTVTYLYACISAIML